MQIIIILSILLFVAIFARTEGFQSMGTLIQLYAKGPQDRYLTGGRPWMDHYYNRFHTTSHPWFGYRPYYFRHGYHPVYNMGAYPYRSHRRYHHYS